MLLGQPGAECEAAEAAQRVFGPNGMTWFFGMLSQRLRVAEHEAEQLADLVHELTRLRQPRFARHATSKLAFVQIPVEDNYTGALLNDVSPRVGVLLHDLDQLCAAFDATLSWLTAAQDDAEAKDWLLLAFRYVNGSGPRPPDGQMPEQLFPTTPFRLFGFLHESSNIRFGLTSNGTRRRMFHRDGAGALSRRRPGPLAATDAGNGGDGRTGDGSDDDHADDTDVPADENDDAWMSAEEGSAEAGNLVWNFLAATEEASADDPVRLPPS